MAIDPQLAGKWTIDTFHSRVGFSTRHAMVARVRGAFNEVSGEVNIDAEGYDRERRHPGSEHRHAPRRP